MHRKGENRCNLSCVVLKAFLADSLKPDIHMFYNTLALCLKLFNARREHIRLQAFHEPASGTQKMGMIRMMARLSHAIPEGPISCRKPLNQASVYQEVLDCDKG